MRALSAQYEQAQQQHAAQVETLRRQVAQLSGQAVSAVTSADLIGILAPIWHTKASTARKLRQRIQAAQPELRVLGGAPARPQKDVFEGRKFEDGKPVSTQQRKNAA